MGMRDRIGKMGGGYMQWTSGHFDIIAMDLT